jgi:hypothetical protein
VWTNSVLGGLHGTAPSFAIFGVVMLGAAIVAVVLVDRAARILGSSGRSARLLLGIAIAAGAAYGAAVGAHWYSGRPPGGAPLDYDCYVARAFLQGAPCVTGARWISASGHVSFAEPHPLAAALVGAVAGGLVAVALWWMAMFLRATNRPGVSRTA